jgi:hypothetical protein
VTDLAAEVWRDVRPAAPAQRLVLGTGALLLVMGLVHVGVLAVDGGPWSGPVTWRKPIVFGLSFGILLLTLALVLRRLPAGRLQWWLAVPVSVASLLEYAAIASQRWRGRPSHFNEATAYDSAVFGVMAVCVAVVVLVVAVLLAWTALPPRTGGFRGSDALRLAVVVGLAGVS